jgi:protein TonB
MEDTQRLPAVEPRDDGRRDTGRVIDFAIATASAHGSPDIPAATGDVDGGNVIVLDSVRPHTTSHDPSAFWIRFGDRPAPPSPADGSWLTLIFAASLAVHAGLIVLFDDEPAPLPSVGVVSLSVELVLGTDLAAGLANAPSPSEAANAAPPTANATSEPQSDVAQQETTPAGPPPWFEQALMLRPLPQPEADKPDKPAGASVNAAQAAPAVPETQSGATSSGIGRGASDADASYPGIVAARLARFKQYPREAHARGDQGTATVTFTLDGDGSVTQVILAKKSGFASLDRESLAMVRRAAPFPPTPTGGPMSFTVPVDFKLR